MSDAASLKNSITGSKQSQIFLILRELSEVNFGFLKNKYFNKIVWLWQGLMMQVPVKPFNTTSSWRKIFKMRLTWAHYVRPWRMCTIFSPGIFKAGTILSSAILCLFLDVGPLMKSFGTSRRCPEMGHLVVR